MEFQLRKMQEFWTQTVGSDVTQTSGHIAISVGPGGCGSVVEFQLSTRGSGSIPASPSPIKKWFILFIFYLLSLGTLKIWQIPEDLCTYKIKGRNQTKSRFTPSRERPNPSPVLLSGQTRIISALFCQGSSGPEGTLDNRLDLHRACFPAGGFGFGVSALYVLCRRREAVLIPLCLLVLCPSLSCPEGAAGLPSKALQCPVRGRWAEGQVKQPG